MTSVVFRDRLVMFQEPAEVRRAGGDGGAGRRDQRAHGAEEVRGTRRLHRVQEQEEEIHAARYGD